MTPLKPYTKILWASLTGDGRRWHTIYHGRPQLSVYKVEIDYGCKAQRVRMVLTPIEGKRRKR